MLVLFILVMLLWTVFVQITPLAPHGLAIRTVRPTIKLTSAGGIMPLRIRVLAGKVSNYRAPIRGIHVGSQIVDRSDFAAFLRREFPNGRPTGRSTSRATRTLITRVSFGLLTPSRHSVSKLSFSPLGSKPISGNARVNAADGRLGNPIHVRCEEPY